MTLLAFEGISKLAEERAREQEEFKRFAELARKIFESHQLGILERELVHRLVEQGATRSVASACADELLSGGIARKNWTSGLLTHVN